MKYGVIEQMRQDYPVPPVTDRRNEAIPGSA
ncbi:hypothetical protein BN2475_1660003 [Paraburkholderia ribeironis]|uniref:Uncharacterized protein n=1 Tax=Paraburkholderia ribeironis TaxID=1247936 RepID=A0A1N7SQP8_9BURK|nr:hypothetical protein BN2475_1660003 [Paraburkholderia ribeironis]